jgi:hypothetical protein
MLFTENLLQAKLKSTHSKTIILNNEKMYLNTNSEPFNCKEKDSLYAKCHTLTAIKTPNSYKVKAKQPLSLKVLNQFQFAKSRNLYRQDNQNSIRKAL